MEIRDSKSSSRISTLRRAESSALATATADGGGTARPLDPVQLSGVPEVELTPRVRQAMMALLAEIDQLRRDLTDARGRIDFLERLADEDPLIPIANRRAFLREVTRMIGFGQRYGTPASIVYVDVNHLKVINDSYGHAAGDAALLQVARTLVEQVRNTDVVARLKSVAGAQTPERMTFQMPVREGKALITLMAPWQTGPLEDVHCATMSWASLRAPLVYKGYC